jgi:hypothetical protein
MRVTRRKVRMLIARLEGRVCEHCRAAEISERVVSLLCGPCYAKAVDDYRDVAADHDPWSV